MSSTVRLGSRRRGKAVTIAQSISIALSSSARTVVQGSTTTLTVTLTRTSYTGDVMLAVTGLPTDVTGSFATNPLTGGTLTSVLTLTAGGSAPTVTADAFTVTASGSGVTDATAVATVTVDTVPDFTIALSSTDRNVVQGGTTDTTISSTRTGGLTEDITLSVSGLPTGVTGAFSINPLTTLNATSVLTLTADGSAPTVTADAFTVSAASTSASDSQAATVTVTTTPGTATPFFSDSFAGGVKNNANGFVWGGGTGGVSVSTENPYSGTHSLRMSYPAVPDIAGDSNTEQRFNMGRYLSELWVDYMLFIPANFSHRNASPSNNKFFTIWRDVYSNIADGDVQFLFEFNRTNAVSTDPNTAKARLGARRWDQRYITDQGLESMTGQYDPLIGAGFPLAPNAWHNVKLHFKAASGPTAEDGVYVVKIDDTLFASKTDGRFWNYPAGINTKADVLLRNGYFLGWSNSGYYEETVFFIDDVNFYESNPGWG